MISRIIAVVPFPCVVFLGISALGFAYACMEPWNGAAAMVGWFGLVLSFYPLALIDGDI